MSPQLKKIIPIFLAVFFGAGIIFFSVNGGGFFGGKVSFDTKDGESAQNDSWKGSLKIVPQNSPSKLLGARDLETRTVATTTTSLLAYEMLYDYASAQLERGDTPLSDIEAEALAQVLSEKVSSSDAIKQYTDKDFVLVTTSTSTLETYRKEATAILNSFAQQKGADELYLVNLAIYSKDPSKLAPLTTNISNLQKLLKGLLALKVPNQASVFHVSLVQGYANILSGVIDMQQILDDPVRGMRGLAKYINGAGLIDSAIATLQIK